MKKILVILILTMNLISCQKEVDLYNPDVSRYKLTENFVVPIKDGNNTIVMYNGDTLYVGNVSVSIEIPKTSLISTKSIDNKLEWHFIPNNNDNGTWHYQINRSGILMFEDIPNGDNDYNDFICYFKEQLQVNVDGFTNLIRTDKNTGLEFSNLEIYPKAMGNSIKIGFGVEIVRVDNGEMIDDILIYGDVRKEAFDNYSGYINTSKELDVFPLYNRNTSYFKGKGRRYFPKNLDKNGFAINYYILVNNNKYYTANSTKQQINKNRTPYGLYIPNVKSFNYPIERASIFNVYPNFKKWIYGENVDPFYEKNNDLIFKMIE